MNNATEFNFHGWTLSEAIDALMAYDGGATDSGIRDNAMKTAVRDYLQSLDQDSFRRTLAYIARDMLTDDAIDRGYGLAEVVRLAEWIDEINVFQ
ncbi:hypothetical protein [Singulisphaera acidiphila]|uniref:Uncharacterized protein n=1 Tax=Singulisphaera acidiphila (strain ATCC BAA-1392 / DSM 18658 / VKM B-2454 / MOB10) TaxID=886293 RepID=L0DHR7_SINAD|nr:hypothetical protein [Singulisphaera acidiphila]AGA28380.1 hypothetical protein Sinac_4173 [Singulisphaera acidiphila DSM 18658]